LAPKEQSELLAQPVHRGRKEHKEQQALKALKARPV